MCVLLSISGHMPCLWLRLRHLKVLPYSWHPKSCPWVSAIYTVSSSAPKSCSSCPSGQNKTKCNPRTVKSGSCMVPSFKRGLFLDSALSFVTCWLYDLEQATLTPFPFLLDKARESTVCFSLRVVFKMEWECFRRCLWGKHCIPMRLLVTFQKLLVKCGDVTFISPQSWGLTKPSSIHDQKDLHDWFSITMEGERRVMHLLSHWSSFLLIDTFASEAQENILSGGTVFCPETA